VFNRGNLLMSFRQATTETEPVLTPDFIRDLIYKGLIYIAVMLVVVLVILVYTGQTDLLGELFDDLLRWLCDVIDHLIAKLTFFLYNKIPI
jgi:hypothetical protein